MTRSFVHDKTEVFQKNGTIVNDHETGELIDNSKTLKPAFGHQEATNKSASPEPNYKPQIVWRNVAIQSTIHATALYGFFLLLTLKIKLITVIFQYGYIGFNMIGITAGAHRLWSHRSYKANLPLRIFLMLAQTSAVQNNIYEWTRDHRVHHKFTDTNADPHNASRGFFFSHVGWLMCKKHPDVIAKGRTIDLSDLLADPVVRFQKKYYMPLIIVINQLIPTLIPWYFFGETLWTSLVISLTRYALTLNGTWLVNSAAHIWGMKPYDTNIKPTESELIMFLRFGEGFHNYHHTFPWDYKAAELGDYRYNFTTAFLDLMAKIGWATDLKTASDDMIKNRSLRTGDGSWKTGKSGDENKNHQIEMYPHDDTELIWGWGDKDMSVEEIQSIEKDNMRRHA